MLFFKRILKEPPAEPEPVDEVPPPVERRKAPRFKVHPDSPLKVVLSFIGRDETGKPMSHSRHGWNWRGRLLDCSEHGVRLQMGPVVKAVTGDDGELIVEMEDFHLTVPCHIANIVEQPAGLVFGVKHDITGEADWKAYRQLLEVIALGATLKRQFKRTKPDESGYLVEQYASDRPARLTIWRDKDDQTPAAFEFLLKDSLVRGAAGELQCLAGADGANAATPAQAGEIRRLFHWVVPNMSPAVPADVRKFLLGYNA